MEVTIRFVARRSLRMLSSLTGSVGCRGFPGLRSSAGTADMAEAMRWASAPTFTAQSRDAELCSAQTCIFGDFGP